MELLVYLIMTFFICSLIGYFIEVFWVFLNSKKFVNRGFLCGPIIPIYGIGALLILICLFRYCNDPLVVFVFGIIITSSLEYFVSFLLEKLFSNKWWDYSSYPYNLNGRICLRNSLAFGVLSLLIVYLFAPFLYYLFNIFSFKFWLISSIILSLIFICDLIYSSIIAYNLRNRIIIVEELKNEKIALIPIIFDKKLKELTANLKGFPSRLLKAFPTLEANYHHSFEKMKEFREETKSKNKKNKYSKKAKRKRK